MGSKGTKNKEVTGEVLSSSSPSFSPHPLAFSLFRLRRKAQTTVEYILVTAALTVAFFAVYRILQYFLSRQFRASGIIILRMYMQDW
ncbi:MAG: hypothetical protein HY796_01720 [Elusimicrobia bacterium]|nr:hypothetical protein [Elusimicrobiota bacterium]